MELCYPWFKKGICGYKGNSLQLRDSNLFFLKIYGSKL
ncbi:hypothetical protein CBB_3263 [Clostridium botulinum Bf]|nr:hypothetical protein CBB_3263 [Clostridium botulinum Bf]